MANEQEVTPEQYKTRLLQQSFAERVIEYEDTIASLRTQIAMLQQQAEGSDDTLKEPDVQTEQL